MIYVFIVIFIIASPLIWIKFWKEVSRNGKKKNERMEGRGVNGTAIFS